MSSRTFHLTEKVGGYKVSWAENSTYRLVPIDADSPDTYSGRYASHLIDRGIFSGSDFVFKNPLTNVGVGSDGSRETFHITTRAVLTPTGAPYETENVKRLRN